MTERRSYRRSTVSILSRYDRTLFQQLINRYGPDQLHALLMNDGYSYTSSNDSASMLANNEVYSLSEQFQQSTTLNQHRVKSECSSDGEDSSVGCPTPSESSMTPSPPRRTKRSTSGVARRRVAAGAKGKGTFLCGFCDEQGILKTCTRKNDLKRHIEDFHHTNTQWICREQNCSVSFDWPAAYKTHLKEVHQGPRVDIEDAKVALCEQTVFACGFENCLRVFEATSDDTAKAAVKDYLNHVVNHFDEGYTRGAWSYSGRMRNLLRQSAMLTAWTESSLSESERSRLYWSVENTGILRKLLETRHIHNQHALFDVAVRLGTSSPVSPMQYDLTRPIRDNCQMMLPGHMHLATASNFYHGISIPVQEGAGQYPGLSQTSLYQTGLGSTFGIKEIPQSYNDTRTELDSPFHSSQNAYHGLSPSPASFDSMRQAPYFHMDATYSTDSQSTSNDQIITSHMNPPFCVRYTSDNNSMMRAPDQRVDMINHPQPHYGLPDSNADDEMEANPHEDM